MLAHAESHGGLRAHQPLRNSTLRHVTATDEDPDTEISPNPSLQHPATRAFRHLSEKPIQRIVTLGIHDRSSAGSTALIDPTVFPEDALKEGVLITISPAPDSDTPINDQFYHGESGNKRGNASTPKPTVNDRQHLFLAEAMLPDPSGKSPEIQAGTSTFPLPPSGVDLS